MQIQVYDFLVSTSYLELPPLMFFLAVVLHILRSFLGSGLNKKVFIVRTFVSMSVNISAIPVPTTSKRALSIVLSP